jgi:hypothetical protein
MGICFSYEEEWENDVFVDVLKDYNNRYDINKIKNIDDNEEKIKDYSNFFIIEYVPIYGNVIMSYNNNENVFTYYCDKSIPCNYLETVSRKYVLSCNYKNIYHKKIQEEEKKETKNKKELPTVYGNIKKKDMINIQSNSKTMNKFINLGRIQDFSMINKSKKQNTKSKISYGDYKLSKFT